MAQKPKGNKNKPIEKTAKLSTDKKLAIKRKKPNFVAFNPNGESKPEIQTP